MVDRLSILIQRLVDVPLIRGSSFLPRPFRPLFPSFQAGQLEKPSIHINDLSLESTAEKSQLTLLQPFRVC